MAFNMKIENIIALIIIIIMIVATECLTTKTLKIEEKKQTEIKIKQQWSSGELKPYLKQAYDKIFDNEGFIKEEIKIKYKDDIEKYKNENTTDDDLKRYDKSFLHKLIDTGELNFDDVNALIEQKKLIMSDNHLATINILHELMINLQENQEMVYSREQEKLIKRFEVPMWFVLNTTPSANHYSRGERNKASIIFNSLKFDVRFSYWEKYNETTKLANFVNREWRQDEGGLAKMKIWGESCKKYNMRCCVLEDKIPISSNVVIIKDNKFNTLLIFYQNSARTNLSNEVSQEVLTYFYNNYDINTEQWLFPNQMNLHKVLSFINLDKLEYLY